MTDNITTLLGGEKREADPDGFDDRANHGYCVTVGLVVNREPRRCGAFMPLLWAPGVALP